MQCHFLKLKMHFRSGEGNIDCFTYKAEFPTTDTKYYGPDGKGSVGCPTDFKVLINQFTYLNSNTCNNLLYQAIGKQCFQLPRKPEKYQINANLDECTGDNELYSPLDQVQNAVIRGYMEIEVYAPICNYGMAIAIAHSALDFEKEARVRGFKPGFRTSLCMLRS